MYSTRKTAGITLLSALITLLIVVLISSLSQQAFSNWIPRQRAHSAMFTFKSLFHFARFNAVQRQKTIRLCAMTNDNKCTNDWSGDVSIAVFLDTNNNQEVDSDDEVLRLISWASKHGDIRWRASLGRRYTDFQQGGNTWQNGTLYYCPRSGDKRYARALVLNHGGRSYQPGDSNGDGIHEDRSLSALSCPL